LLFLLVRSMSIHHFFSGGHPDTFHSQQH
jgi:hypothetical protein